MVMRQAGHERFRVMTAQPAAGAGRRPPLGLSCASSPRTPGCAGGSHPTSSATRTRSSSRGRAWRSSSNGNSATPTWEPRRLPAGHRSFRDHRRRPLTAPANHLSECGPHAVTDRPLAEQPSGRRFPFAQPKPGSRSHSLVTGRRRRAEAAPLKSRPESFFRASPGSIARSGCAGQSTPVDRAAAGLTARGGGRGAAPSALRPRESLCRLPRCLPGRVRARDPSEHERRVSRARARG